MPSLFAKVKSKKPQEKETAMPPAVMNAPPVVAPPVAQATPVASSNASSPAPVVPSETPADGAPAPKTRKKQVRVVGVDYAGAAKKNEAGLLTEVPSDYNKKMNKKLTAKSFADEAVYFDFMVSEAQKTAAKYQKLATQSRQLGNVGAEKVKAKKLLKYTAMLAELEAELSGKGVDVGELKKLGMAKKAAE